MVCPECAAATVEEVGDCAACGAALTSPPGGFGVDGGGAKQDLERTTAIPSTDFGPVPSHLNTGVLPAGFTPPGVANRPLASGSVLAGRYRIERLLGRGGMGEVYLAHDRTLAEDVALKILPGAGQQGGSLELFLGEVRVARRITHPNVCRVHDVGEAEGRWFLSMELVDGEDLGVLLARGALRPDRAARLGQQAALGLAAAHERGILHRDLKPGNLMVTRDDRVLLADFGLAGLIDSRAAGGTPAYMAPELFAGGRSSVQSDLYALGLVLYELYSGQRPFQATTLTEIARQHREETPAAVSERVTVDPAIEAVVLRCLEKDPRRRPGSATLVAAVLAGEASVSSDDLSASRLRRWPPPPWPERPYPVLLPYRHPALLAGRDADLEGLERMLRTPRLIVGLSAPSGAGKSSLLEGGLAPRLRGRGQPCALERYPVEPGFAGRILSDLLDEAVAIADDDHESFIERLVQVAELSAGSDDSREGLPPILIVDQFEDLFRLPGQSRARAGFGALLAASALRRPGQVSGPCRWLLAYREEYHGQVVTWLSDVLSEARRIERPGLRSLPHDLSAPDRFGHRPLPPLATAAAGAEDPLEDSTRVFLRAIEAPLEVANDDGSRRYPWRFAAGAAQELARSFARARVDQPNAPLAPELQVVLAHLMDSASPAMGGDREISLPDDPTQLVDRALEQHLQLVFAAAFPVAGGRVRRRAAMLDRARALLTLRELADSSGARDRGRTTVELEEALGGDSPGPTLELLAGPSARLVVARREGNEVRWVLSHDRLAAAVVRLVEEDGRGLDFELDTELLALRRFVALESSLHRSGTGAGRVLTRRRHRQLSRHGASLIWTDEQREWWAAADESWRRRARRVVQLSIGALFALIAMTAVIVQVTRARGATDALLAQLTNGGPEAAAIALDEALDAAIPDSRLIAGLAGREAPAKPIERGLGGVPQERRGELALAAARLLQPLLTASAIDRDALRGALRGALRDALASTIWALDAFVLSAPELAVEGARLRDELLEPLRQLHPPPERKRIAGEGWAVIPAGTFMMGSAPGEESVAWDPVDPPYEVTLDGFLLLDHEVTNAEFRRFDADHRGADDRPAVGLSWYDAILYSAWLGGRLPTESEWEYAARAGCAGEWCDESGAVVPLGRVAWYVSNTTGEDGVPSSQPVRLKQPNAWGLHDMLGNVREWTADWLGPYPSEPATNPVGPPTADPAVRVYRGGSAGAPPEDLSGMLRSGAEPEFSVGPVGFRPLMPLGSFDPSSES